MASSFTPGRTGQIVVPIAPRSIQGLTADEIATEVAPAIVDAAAAVGGAPVGEPELLREDEVRARTDDPNVIANLDRHPDRLWLVADMVPAEQAAEVARNRPGGSALEVVAPPLRRRPPRRR